MRGTWLCMKAHPILDVIYMLKHREGWVEPETVTQRVGDDGTTIDYMVIPGDVK